MAKKTKNPTAGYTAHVGKWDFRRLVPAEILKPGDSSAFLKELLLHADITREEERVALLFIEGNGIREVSRELGVHRVEIQKIQKKVYVELKKVLEGALIWWSPRRCFWEEVSDKVKLSKRLAEQRALRIRLEADAKGYAKI